MKACKALSLILLVGAGLLMRSFVALRETDLGFAPDHILTARLPLPSDRYKTAEQLTGFYRPLLERLAALPGVVEATETSTLPPYGGIRSEIEVDGKTDPEKWNAVVQLCSEGYFAVLKIVFREGRTFTEAEVSGARKVAVVNETFAKKYLAKTSPIGQRIRVAELTSFPDKVEEPWFEVIGVVRDARNQGLEDAPLPEAWLPYTVTGSGERVTRISHGGRASPPLWPPGPRTRFTMRSWARPADQTMPISRPSSSLSC
jgi:hypothetical protein